ncbi:MAG: hypothetical protein KDI98_08105 [Hyphomicrobiaceae bacterium]|nr:hypothetical protein [Hyphomicrobiaceae bacterium]
MTGMMTVAELFQAIDTDTPPVVIDVRREAARLESGRTMAFALRALPERADVWAPSFAGCRTVVFCVHGHEVGRTCATILAREGSGAVFLQGGFEAWLEAGYPTVPLLPGSAQG